MRRAFEKAAESGEVEGPLGKMMKRAVVRTSRRKKNRQKKSFQQVNKDPHTIYEKRIKRTLYAGVGSLRPANLLSWKPGQPALAGGKPCRIKWALTDGQHTMVVVLYDLPQPLAGTEQTIKYGVYQLSDLRPCDCAGYIHTKGCRPRRK